MKHCIPVWADIGCKVLFKGRLAKVIYISYNSNDGTHNNATPLFHIKGHDKPVYLKEISQRKGKNRKLIKT